METLTAQERNLQHFNEAARSADFQRALQVRGLTRIDPAEGRRLLRRCRWFLGTEPVSQEWALEIGCGNGYLLGNLEQAGAVRKGVGLDLSLEYLKLSRAGLNGSLRWVVADVMRMPFSRRFDLVVGQAILHHLPDLEGTLRQLRGLLVPSGKAFFFGEPHPIRRSEFRSFKKGYARLIHRLREGLRGPVVKGNRDSSIETEAFPWSPEEIHRAAFQAGFAECRVGEFGLLESYLSALLEPWLIGFPWKVWQRAGRGCLTAAEWVDQFLLRYTPLWRWRTGLCVYLSCRAAP